MKLILEVTQVSGINRVVCKDAVGRTFNINTSMALRRGQSILVENGIVINIVNTVKPRVYEV